MRIASAATSSTEADASSWLAASFAAGVRSLKYCSKTLRHCADVSGGVSGPTTSLDALTIAPHLVWPMTTSSRVPSAPAAYSTLPTILPSPQGQEFPAFRSTKMSPACASNAVSIGQHESAQPTTTARGFCPCSAKAVRRTTGLVTRKGRPPTYRALPSASITNASSADTGWPLAVLIRNDTVSSIVSSCICIVSLLSEPRQHFKSNNCIILVEEEMGRVLKHRDVFGGQRMLNASRRELIWLLTLRVPCRCRLVASRWALIHESE
mmetsp:Transcript_146669/g.365739  ORF Transcript_146669/g.365739 Transcript_146669/m.365739 type:complete len:266 (-) Transcript_146669:20-817(-)